MHPIGGTIKGIQQTKGTHAKGFTSDKQTEQWTRYTKITKHTGTYSTLTKLTNAPHAIITYSRESQGFILEVLISDTLNIGPAFDKVIIIYQVRIKIFSRYQS